MEAGSYRCKAEQDMGDFPRDQAHSGAVGEKSFPK